MWCGRGARYTRLTCICRLLSTWNLNEKQEWVKKYSASTIWNRKNDNEWTPLEFHSGTSNLYGNWTLGSGRAGSKLPSCTPWSLKDKYHIYETSNMKNQALQKHNHQHIYTQRNEVRRALASNCRITRGSPVDHPWHQTCGLNYSL
jgi:hypothetical protein